MPDNEKKYLANIEEVDVDSIGKVLVREDDVKPEYVEVEKEVPVEVVKEVEVIKEVEKPVEVIKEVPVEVPVEVVKEVEIEKEVIKEVEVPVEVVKEVEVPVEVVKEVEIIKEVEKPVEVIKEVPVEVIKEVPVEVVKEVEVPVEVIKEVEVVKEVEKPVEVIKEVPVEVIREVEKIVYVEVPVEVIKEVEVVKEVPVEVIKEVPVPVAAPEEPEEQPEEDNSNVQAEIAATAVAVVDDENDNDTEVDIFGNVIRYRKSFMAKLIQTQYPNQDYYEELKNELLSYKGVKSRVSWNYDSFNKGRKKCVKIAIKGKTLIVYLALNPNDYKTSKYHHFDASDVSRFEDVPFGLKVRSDRALKYAKELIEILMTELGLVKREIKYENYHRRYENNEKLLKEGLIKLIGGNNQAYEGETDEGEELQYITSEEQLDDLTIEPIEDFESLETVEEAETVETPDVVPAVATEVKPKYVNKSFAQKMLLADEVIQDRYDELKNYALRFKKLKARISKKFDSINKGRLQFVKLSVAGKTLKLFLNMDIMTTDPKFHCKDMKDKKTYEPVPVLLRIKSGRAVKYAKILIDQCAESHGLVENKKFKEVDAMALVEQAVASKKKN